jgi:glycosyltransferase involved in cell wall biosynthesis
LAGASRILFKRFLASVDGVVANSRGTEAEFVDHGFRKTIAVSNGVDLDAFNLLKTKQQLRSKLHLPQDKTIIMYVGHLYAWKGVDVMMETAGSFQQDTVLFVMVGGTEKDSENIVTSFRKKA